METTQPQRLSELEAVIEGGIRSFVETGNALLEISNDPELLAATGYATFDAYCVGRWKFKRRRANQMIEAAVTVGNIGNMLPNFPMPSNPRQAAALAEVAQEHRADTWAAVVRERGADVTARDVREVAQVLETLRAEPDGPALIEEVTSGNWDIPEVKKELEHRGVEWNPAKRREAEEARESDALIEAAAYPGELDDARLHLAYTRGVKHLALLVQLDPESLAAALKPHEIPGLRTDIRLTREWFDAVERAIAPRAGLRVVS